MGLIFKRAGSVDVELLVKTRVMVLREANRLEESADLSEVERMSYEYYRESLPAGAHVAYLVFEGDTVVGTGGISFYRVMPTCYNPSGYKAYVMNMYTHPNYRRKGIARQMLDLLVNEAEARGIRFISLEATAMGRPLYERCGFAAMKDEMLLAQPGSNG